MESVGPLIVITGPTASGKSGLAMELARKYGGEIICADSRTIYRGMDTGTAKPTAQDQALVPHHLLDVVDPDQTFTVADFQRLAREAIDDIRARGRVPFLVGGSGLYIDSVVLNYTLPSQEDRAAHVAQRQVLESKSVEELQQLIKKQQLEMPHNLKNKRHLVNTLLRTGQQMKRNVTPGADTYVVSIATEKSILEDRITKRANEMFVSGVLEEARELSEKYGWHAEAMTGVIYRILHQVIDGTMSESDALQTFIIHDRQLVKKQLTWLRRHDFVQWLSLDEARGYLEQVLSSRK